MLIRNRPAKARLCAGRLISVTVATVAVSGALGPGSANAASGLSGAGATSIAPLVSEWAAAYQAFYGTAVAYTPVGAQSGVSDVSARSVDFASSDAPLSSSGLTACNCYQIPWSLTAVGIGYHIHGVGSGLYLSGRVLAEIYLGQITRWNDPRIKALNRRLSLPALSIAPVYANGSGETYTFTRYLSQVDESWRKQVGSGLTVTFPTGISVNADPGVVTYLSSTDGSIGYVGPAFLIANRLPAAAIENSAGRFEYPNLSEIQSAGKTVKHVPASNALSVVNPPRSAQTAYPLSMFIYVVVRADPAQKSELTRWISFALGSGQRFGPGLDFASLPAVVKRASSATLGRFSH